MRRGAVTPARLGAAVAALVVIADQLAKWWMLTAVMTPPRVIPLTPFFNLVLVRNRGVSFGLFGGAPDWVPWFLTVFALLIAAALAIWLRRADSRLLGAALGLVIGGALGNVVDRVRYGAVVDFLDLYYAGYHWPAFNLADSAITAGVLLLILDSLKPGPGRP